MSGVHAEMGHPHPEKLLTFNPTVYLIYLKPWKQA